MELSKLLRGVIVVFFVVLCLLPVWQTQAESNPDNVNALWVAESEGVLKVRSADGSVLFEIPYASDIRGLAIDEQRGVLWAASHTSLRAYHFNGALLRSTPLNDTNVFDKDILVRINPENGHVWLSRDYKLFHFDSEGNPVGVVELAGSIQSLSLDNNHNRVWVVTWAGIISIDSASLAQTIVVSAMPPAIGIEAIAYDGNQ